MHNEITILIAEDNIGHLALIKRNLKRAGVGGKVLTFADGQEMLEFIYTDGEVNIDLSSGKYLMILDIRMPKVDGIEVLQRIKGDNRLKQIPIVILTTTDDPLEIEMCYSYGCNIYINKPVQYEEFVKAVQSLGLFSEALSLPMV